MLLDTKVEAILFAGAKPFSKKYLAELCDTSVKDIESALDAIETRLETSGITLQRLGNEVQLSTKPEHAKIVQEVLREELYGELTRPSLEALTILAYRGPLTRPELEQIRGVHSSLILRNLMLRGLVEEQEETRLGQPTYAVTFDFMQHLGLKSLKDLPEYDELRTHENVADVLDNLDEDEARTDGSKVDRAHASNQEGGEELSV